jgi:tetratricopeptide (TPR) repeat protein
VFTNENYEKVKERMNSNIYLVNPEDDPEYWNKMAYSLTAEGKLDKARYYYEKALDVDPDNKSALHLKSAIAYTREMEGEEDDVSRA